MSRRGLFAVAAAACVGCCIGPILGVLGAIAALGVFGSVVTGAGALLITAAAIIATVIVVRRHQSCAVETAEVPIELTRRSA